MNRLLLVSTIVLGVTTRLPAQGRPSKPGTASQASAPEIVQSLTNLFEAKIQAQRRQQPILARITTTGCLWCEKLEETLKQPELQNELRLWTVVVLSADEPSKDTRALGLTVVPALRVLSASGRVVASHDGFLPADKLLAWLKDQRNKAAVKLRDELLAEDRPELVGVVRLVAEFSTRDALVREAAIRRLAPYPELAAEAVAEAFVAGPLQARLTALELLQIWEAPIGPLDPWRPESLEKSRLERLRKWAAAPSVKKHIEPTADEWQAIKKDLERLIEADEADAMVLRERLARHGKAILPEVVIQIPGARTDQARERLTALRYRLTASAALALNWPGGLERLAATSATLRHQALRELESRATGQDEALLLELFSNPDPFVREISLRALKDTSGGKSSGALVTLLDDPEPNVRAAVLKQLAEAPLPNLVPRLVEYVRKEKDGDLLVHAVRALRENTDKSAAEGLGFLLDHERWQVRAEAAEALGKYLDHYSEPKDWKAEIVVSLVKLLDDPDGFVVSKAIPVVGRFDLDETIAPLVRVVEKHPDLAVPAIQALSSRSRAGGRVVPHLRRFCADVRPEIRAAAITALAGFGFNTNPYGYSGSAAGKEVSVAEELHRALKDPSPLVRTAAAQTLVHHFIGRQYALSRNLQGGTDIPARLKAVWIDGVRKDIQQLDWLKGAPDLLRSNLASADPDERLTAALALVMLGERDQAMTTLYESVAKHGQQHGKEASALPWLAWDERIKFFNHLLRLQPDEDHLSEIVTQFAAIPEERSMVEVWKLLEQPKASIKTASAVATGLLQIYYQDGLSQITNGQYQLAKELREAAAKSLVPRIQKGPDLQRLVGLTLLAPADAERTGALARSILEDASASAELRRDAFQLLLLIKTQPEAQRLAIENLKHQLAEVREFALATLAEEDYSYIRGSLYVQTAQGGGSSSRHYYPGGGSAGPAIPKDLKPEMVRPFLAADKPRMVALAAYLLTLLDDPAAFPIVEKYWRTQARDDETWQRRMYSAVAALGDDSRTPLLEEIYQSMRKQGSYYLRDFYWTIRVMDGPSVLRLRKQMRDEVGMANLQ